MLKISIRMILMLQWALTILALSASWLPAGYQWCQFSIIGFGVWSLVDRESVEAIFLYLCGTMVSILLDIINIASFYALVSASDSSLYKFSAAMAIIHLIAKPFECIILYHMYKERGGEYGINIGLPGSMYENIGDESEAFNSPGGPHQGYKERNNDSDCPL